MSGFDMEKIQEEITAEFSRLSFREELEGLRIKYLGRKGILARLTGSIPQLPPEQRAGRGQLINALKDKLAGLIEEKARQLPPRQEKEAFAGIDIGMPGIKCRQGKLHPISQVTKEICDCFCGIGFKVVKGPEIENEHNNFSGLNIPLEHPSRDAFDTFYLKGDLRQEPGFKNSKAGVKAGRLLLRSHTSPVQIRVMQTEKPPLAIIVPGRVYRPDAVDASHMFMFHQVEGFMVDEGVRFSDLKGVLELFAKRVFGGNIKMRFRPHFFPFTEPSAEADISCIICSGKGCSVCAGKGWLEILGAGMIHPNVFANVGYDNRKYSGFAFGMGVDRIAMLKYGIDDIRLFFQNDLRFLSQF